MHTQNYQQLTKAQNGDRKLVLTGQIRKKIRARGRYRRQGNTKNALVNYILQSIPRQVFRRAGICVTGRRIVGLFPLPDLLNALSSSLGAIMPT